ncbi:MAG: RNA polymerase factor sigma-54 [Gordonibacter sp.]|nr:RNA polymerase factor sigma-54 [Gordonibacter sp.]
MNFDQRPDLSVQQHLHLTTELKQGISILRMSATELSEYANKCVEENPFFDDDDWIEPRHSITPDRYAREVSADALFEKRGHGSPENFDGERGDLSQRSFSFDRFLTEGDTLDAFLLEQLRMQSDCPRMRAIGEYLIGNIDANGYLRISVGQVADALGVSEQEVTNALVLVQQFEPTGVGARNLAECLALQLEKKGQLTATIERLVKGRLSEFETRTPASIAHDMGLTLTQLNEALDVIRTCNPRPASQFGRPSRPIWPEVVVTSCGKGDYEVGLQDFYLPHLKINPTYRALASKVKEQETEAYLREKLKEAESLISNINFRHATLYKVACYLVEMQIEFFDKGYDCLRPLTMARVAEACAVSESTVSRIVNGNYMQTPRGVFELKFFFHSSTCQSSDRVVSSISIKKRLSELISKEDSSNPFSDQALSEALERDGVSVSRRTVNKYRDELGIPARAARRRS